VHSITCQPVLRPALPQITVPKEYRDERALFIRLDEILTISGLEEEFISLSMEQHGFDPAKLSAKRSAKFGATCTLALRTNIARQFKGLDHRDFCVRLADSPLLQWFLQIGRVDKVKAFAKSTSNRFAHWLDEDGLHRINAKLTALLAGSGTSAAPLDIGLKTPVFFDDIYFDSTCLKVGLKKLLPHAGDGASLDAAAGVVLAGLVVEPGTTGGIFNVSFSNENPAIVQEVLATIVEKYKEKHLLVYRPPEARNYVSQRVDVVRLRLNETETLGY
jgi:hypothetical protein